MEPDHRNHDRRLRPPRPTVAPRVPRRSHDETRELSPGARGMTVEEALDQLAGVNGIDRDDWVELVLEGFPRPQYPPDLEPPADICAACGDPLSA